MPTRVQPLTQLQERKAKPKDKPYKLADGGGPYLVVMPTGGKLWRMKYRQPDGKENRLSFGSFPEVSLAGARARRDGVRQLIVARADPGRVRLEEARQERIVAENTLERIARAWHEAMIRQWQPQNARDILRRLELDISPEFGQLSVAHVQPSDVLDANRAGERRGER
jgi:hypothetical protein